MQEMETSNNKERGSWRNSNNTKKSYTEMRLAGQFAPSPAASNQQKFQAPILAELGTIQSPT